MGLLAESLGVFINMITGAKSNIRRIADHMRDLCWAQSVRLEMFRGKEADRYLRRINAIHRLLGIPTNYETRGLPLQHEAETLVAVSCAAGGQTRLMTPTTRDAFLALAAAAQKDGLNPTVKWAFRSVDDQARLIRTRLRWGAGIEELLETIAAPGFSEHHSGRALDFKNPAEQRFEDSAEFEWLTQHAERFHFRMSYPAGNGQGIAFEPWHWYCYRDDE